MTGLSLPASQAEADELSRIAHDRLSDRDDLRMHGSERVVVVLYPDFTALDMAGPQYFLGCLMGAQVLMASTAAAGTVVRSDTGLQILTTASLAEIVDCDVILVPGSGHGLAAAVADEALIGQLGRLAAGARVISSVCTGSLILGAAGLLAGRRATSHWAVRYLLPLFGAIAVGDRVVRDGPVCTAAGVTAGIDLGLALAAELRGPGYRDALALQAEISTPNPAGLADIEAQIAGMLAGAAYRVSRSAARLAAPGPRPGTA